MSDKLHVTDSVTCRLKALTNLAVPVTKAGTRRILRGPLRPGWNWIVEVGTEVLRTQLQAAFALPIQDARTFLDAFNVDFPSPPGMQRTAVEHSKFRGDWFEIQGHHPLATVLYFHGGGYTFYPRAYSYFVQLITQAARSRIFALDYRLAPEHPFPAQLEDAIEAYRWILAEGVSPQQLILAGDSAGAHLAISSALKLRDLNLPMPALVIAMSPPTDFEAHDASFADNARFDWIQKPMLEKWVHYFCSPADRENPLVFLNRANLRGLCPIYIQYGCCEILQCSIEAFAATASSHGAEVRIDGWPDMNHVFQLFGAFAAQSSEALSRIGKAIESTVSNNDHFSTVVPLLS